MKDDPELQMDDTWSDDSGYSSEENRFRPRSSKFLPILLGIFLVVVLGGGIFYFITRRLAVSDEMVKGKMTAFEQKISDLERQILDLQGKLGTGNPESALLPQLDALVKRVVALEEKQQTAESKAKPAKSSKSTVSTEKQYHIVQKGETLYRISKKYGITKEELLKLNKLSADQSLRYGQKLLVSPGS